jgi:hypothetical protein
MVKHSKFCIPHSKYFLSLLLVGSFSSCFLLVGLAAPMHIHDDSSVNQPNTICIMKVPRQSPMRIRDVACKCAVNYPHHEGA